MDKQGSCSRIRKFRPKDQKTGRLHICHCLVFSRILYQTLLYCRYTHMTKILYKFVIKISNRKTCVWFLFWVFHYHPNWLIEILSTFQWHLVHHCQVPSTWMLSWWGMVWPILARRCRLFVPPLILTVGNLPGGWAPIGSFTFQSQCWRDCDSFREVSFWDAPMGLLKSSPFCTGCPSTYLEFVWVS